MSKGPRILLQTLQVVGLLGTLLFLAASLAWHLADLDFTGFAEDSPLEQWAIGFGVLTVALSPALWSLARGGSAAPVAASSGSFDRAAPAPAAPQQPGKPGGVFEPMNPAAAPAAPASSYGQPAAGFGSQPQGESPWGAGR
ncbi:hypothetical protein [Glycomyces sp. NPDC047010]|uniref:hypothetical protein n=1 Tax=Glycomyces sp. NPDC047010 TaxID=3155023 RepID=UPI0033C74C8E